MMLKLDGSATENLNVPQLTAIKRIMLFQN